ncbi:hypothetical protein niasHT_025208 [Heterodera trifolii]|uniref:Ubiquitin-like domain-containing protein n=1 Tax=Heterodera trifolii TaxID=157864 RepID=A0ABD2JLE9_9BILA
MKKHFGFSLFSVGIAAGLMSMLFMQKIMPSSAGDYKVFVMIMNEQLFKKHGDFISIDLEKGASAIPVIDLKAKIKQKIGIPPERQTLRCKKPYGIPCSGDISHNETVFMSLDEFEVAVWYTGKKHGVWVKKTDTVSVLKKKIQGVISIDPASQTLYQFDLDDLESAIGVKINERVLLGEMSGQQEQNKIEEIMSKIDGKVLDEEDGKKTMAQHGIKAEANIFVLLDGFEIFVQYGEEEIDKNGVAKWKTKPYYIYWVNATDTVATLKYKIANEEVHSFHSSRTILAQQLTLRLGSHYGIALEDNQTMKDCGIGRLGIVYASSFEFKIFVLHGGKLYTTKVNMGDSVETLKHRIKTIIGISPEHQTLRRDRPYAEVLENNKRTMESYKIHEDTTVFLALDEFVIHVDYLLKQTDKKGNNVEELETFTYNVWVKGTDTAAVLKQKIDTTLAHFRVFNYEFISGHECITAAGGDKNVKTVEQCGIKKGHAFEVKKKSEV